MNDDLPCGWPYEQQRMQDEQTLEAMIDSMGLRGVMLLLQEICYSKAQHIQENWQDYGLAMEWATTGNKLGKWAKLIGPRQ